ncbi:hypothetical protein HU200_021380 [Digitaria exilis]|uniref:RING-CH-type domain-containing protein n=1 Tax=Digitaria exilis TaxID=1010633 RepID=A0A835F0B1_9POAL|nr:hypothetical protein HU200_021380 [Digitaria exilis]
MGEAGRDETHENKSEGRSLALRKVALEYYHYYYCSTTTSTADWLRTRSIRSRASRAPRAERDRPEKPTRAMPAANARGELRTVAAVPGAVGPTQRTTTRELEIDRETGQGRGEGAKAKQPTTGETEAKLLRELGERKRLEIRGGRGRMLEREEATSSSSSSVALMRQCRICHDEEDDRRSTMESPCGCSGSLKVCLDSSFYAHRGCVQRWCDEKGSTLCEICLQVRTPDRSVPSPFPFLPSVILLKTACSVRRANHRLQPPNRVLHSSLLSCTVANGVKPESLEVPRLNYEPEEQEDAAALASAGDPEYAESASWCRSVAVTFTIVLLLRHLVTVATVGAANQFAFSLLTVYLLRASGILLPFYVVMRLISVIQQGQRQYRLQLLQDRSVVLEGRGG